MPISFATARSDSPAAPSVASCRRAISVISLISSARTRSRAVRLAFTETHYQSTALQTRAALALASPIMGRPCGQSVLTIALIVCDHGCDAWPYHRYSPPIRPQGVQWCLMGAVGVEVRVRVTALAK